MAHVNKIGGQNQGFSAWAISCNNTLTQSKESPLNESIVNPDVFAKQLVQPGTRNVLDLTGDWYLAENQRLGNLEFFNRIGRERKFITTKTMLF